MDQMNMTTFSSFGNILGEEIVTVDEVCEIHGIKKITAFGREPICEECVKAEIAEQDKEISRKAKEISDKRDTYDWLDKRSIILDETLLDANFETYRTEDSETVKNKELARQIAGAYYKGANFNTIFTGKAGTGKSHLSMSMLKAVNENSQPYKRCLFVSLGEMMRRIKDSFNNRESKYTERAMVELLIEADLLVLDDLGAETGAITSDRAASDFTTKVLYAIINGRMKKPTIFTTNLSSKEITKMYDAKLVSRMYRGTEGHRIIFKETNDKRLLGY